MSHISMLGKLGWRRHRQIISDYLIPRRNTIMRRQARMSAQAAGLLLGLAGSAQAQFLVIGDDNKLLHFDDGKPVFTEPG
jgi:hypothetical protein